MTRIHPVLLVLLLVEAVFLVVWLAATLLPGTLYY
jgi:hypothetical protein